MATKQPQWTKKEVILLKSIMRNATSKKTGYDDAVKTLEKTRSAICCKYNRLKGEKKIKYKRSYKKRKVIKEKTQTINHTIEIDIKDISIDLLGEKITITY